MFSSVWGKYTWFEYLGRWDYLDDYLARLIGRRDGGHYYHHCFLCLFLLFLYFLILSEDPPPPPLSGRTSKLLLYIFLPSFFLLGRTFFVQGGCRM